MKIQFKYSAVPSDDKNFKWMVVAELADTTPFPICYVKRHFQDDLSIANAIALSLNEGKYLPNFEI